MLNKDDILNADDLNTDVIEVPEWGGEVTIQALTGATREQFELLYADEEKANDPNIRASLAMLSIVDDAGQLMFEQADVIRLGKKSFKALDRVFRAAQKLNGLGGIEEDEKN